MRHYAGTDFFAERFNIRAGGVAGINQEIGVFFGYLCAADLEPAASCFVDELPSLLSFGILEG